MIKAKDGEVTLRGTRSDIIAEAVTILHTLKKGSFRERVQNGN